ncbi:MAG TPA: hypothetical protein VFF32_14565 [Dermatophilaceae bacterium]|nr:hypothetical protein [Dermatophilaceae bacterium]
MAPHNCGNRVAAGGAPGQVRLDPPVRVHPDPGPQVPGTITTEDHTDVVLPHTKAHRRRGWLAKTTCVAAEGSL